MFENKPCLTIRQANYLRRKKRNKMTNEDLDRVLGYILYSVLWTLTIVGVPFIIYYS